MDDKQLDNLFREKLSSHSAPVERNDELWDEIAASLDKAEGGKTFRRRKHIFYAVSSVAAVLIVAMYLFAPGSPEPDRMENSLVIAEGTPVEKLPEAIPTIQPIFQPKKQPVKKKQASRAPGISSTITQHPVTVTDDFAATDHGNVHGEYAAPAEGRRTESQMERKADPAGGAIRVAEDLYGEWDEPEMNFVGKKRKKTLLALASNFAAGNNSNAVHNVSQRTLMAAGQNGLAGIPLIEQVSETKYSLPLNLGVQFQIRINSLLAVGAGVNYSMLRSKYDGLVDKKMSSVRQTLHYIGVPVNLYATILQKNDFFVYANVGGTLEKGIRASYVLKSYDETTRYHTAIDGMQFSVNFGLGAEYRFIKQLGLYVEPNAVYFFNSKVPNSIRTDQPFQLRAEIGFRLHF